MRKHTPKKRIGPVASVLTILVATIGSFSLGIQSSDDASFVSSIMAGSSVEAGDFDGNGLINNDDVTIAIELSASLRAATVEELKADPNQDGRITASDTLWLMQHIKYSVTTERIR